MSLGLGSLAFGESRGILVLLAAVVTFGRYRSRGQSREEGDY